MIVLINSVLIFSGGYIAYKQFKQGHEFLGWMNMFASAVNMAAVVVQLT